MTTIAKLVTAVEADPRGLTRGLQQGASDIRRFTDTMRREMRNLPSLNIVTPTHFNTLLKQTKGDLEKATEAANRLNRGVEGIAASMAKMRASSRLLADEALSRQIVQADPFIAGAGPIGFQMGQTMARTMSQGFAQGNAIGNIRRVLEQAGGGGRGLGGLFNASGPITRTQGALLSMAFTLGNLGEQLATADTKWQKLDRTIGTVLQTAASVAVFFGPGGMIVAAIATALNFLSSFWTQQREEIERTAKAMEEATKRMIDAGETAPMISRIAAIEQGPRSADKSALVPGAYAGGLLDLEAQLRQQEAALRTANFATVLGIQKHVDELKAKIAPLQAEKDRLMAAILDPTPRREMRPASAISVSAPAVKTPTADEQLAALTGQASQLLGLHKALGEQQRAAPDVALRLLRVYDQLAAKLATMKNRWSDQALTIRQAMTDLEATSTIQVARGTVPGITPPVGITPSRAPMKPFEIKIPELEKLPVTLGQQMKLAFQPLIDAIGKMGDFLLNAGLGLLSKYGGAGGQAIAGIAGSAIAGAQLGGPIGAVVGGAVGVVDALFSMGRAAKQARQEFLAFLDAQEQFIMQQQVLLGDITQSQFDIDQLGRMFDAQRAPLEKKIRSLEFVLNNITIGLHPEQRARMEAELADLQSRLNTLNDLERRRVEQLEKGVDAIGRMTDAAAQLSNVPMIWKVNLARFRAANEQDERDRESTRPGGRGLGRGFGSVQDTSVAAGGSALVVHGNVTIQTAAKSGAELWKELETAAKRQSLRVSGSTGNWQRTIL